MVTKFLRFRPLQLCIIAGLCVYVLLSVIDTIYSQGQKTKVHVSRVEVLKLPERNDNNHRETVKSPEQRRTSSGESLKNIEILLEKISQQLEEKNGDKSVDQELSKVKDIVSALFGDAKLKQSENRTYTKNGYLEEPIQPAPPIPKVELDALPFMKDTYYEKSKCPRTLQKMTKYSKWFRDRYIPDVKIFLEPSDINEFEKYYKLEHYVLPFGTHGAERKKFGDIVNNVNFTNTPFFKEGRPKCVSCAVVGCGGVLNGSNVGEEIDNHDFVFRLNHAYSSGNFAKDAGSKTSFYTFFPESMHIEDVADNSSSFFFTMFKWYDVDYGINMMEGENPPIFTSRGKKYKLRKPPLSNKNLRFIHPDFFRYIFTRYLDAKSHRPTTGALVVFLAIHLCDEVSIYGFGYDPRFTLHYYDKKFVSHTDKSTALHDVDNERDLWKQLHQEGIIRLFKRDD